MLTCHSPLRCDDVVDRATFRNQSILPSCVNLHIWAMKRSFISADEGSGAGSGVARGSCQQLPEVLMHVCLSHVRGVVMEELHSMVTVCEHLNHYLSLHCLTSHDTMCYVCYLRDTGEPFCICYGSCLVIPCCENYINILLITYSTVNYS